MKLTQTNDVKVYTVAGSDTVRSLPDWLVRKRKRSLKQDTDYQSRIELVQDFGFPEAANKIRVSEDGQYCMATGVYKPQIHLYDFNLLSLSFERHTTTENLTFLLLSQSWTKSVHLQIDRGIEFHTPMGMHHRIRVPKYGRDLVYSPQLAEVLVPADGREIYRVNLERGGFMKPFEAEENVGEVLTGATTPVHGLLAFGTDMGTTEFFDPRAKSRIGTLQLPGRESIGALTFDPTGLSIATGSSEGMIRLYDLRSPVPLLTRDQGYSYPIRNIIYLPPVHAHASETRILSADKRIVKIWSPRDGKPWTSIEPTMDINDVAHVPVSGMIFTANEGPDMHTFFVPELGPAPRWCSFLDNLTEEMEESMVSSAGGSGGMTTTYDNYKFLTKPELQSLSLSHLVGTSVLRPYMHGFFVKQELYEQAKLIANPWGWEDERKRMIQAKIEKERESRIRSSSKKVAQKVKLNQKLAERLVNLEEKMEKKAARKAEKEGSHDEEEVVDAGDAVEEPKKTKTGGILQDERFKELFTNPDFEVDENSAQYFLHNPSAKNRKTDGDNDEERPTGRKKTAVEEELEESSGASSSEPDDENDTGSESGSDYGGQYKTKQESRNAKTKQKVEKKEPQMRVSTFSYKNNGHFRDENGVSKYGQAKEQSFGSRLSNGGAIKKRDHRGGPKRSNITGEMEISWIPGNRKGRDQGSSSNQQQSSRPSGNPRYNKDRRSASGNAFRRLGV